MRRCRGFLPVSVLMSVLLAGAAFAGGARTGGFSGAAPGAQVLRAPAPAWWTPELRARVLAAGPEGVPLSPEVEAAIPASSLTYLGIRPGQLILVETNDGTALCSSNFVFTSGGTSASFFIGTAGHCGNVGDQVTMLFLPAGLVNIGKIVKSAAPPVDRDGNFDITRLDFALIEITPALNAHISPSMAYWGGPTGVYTGTAIQPIQHAGWGLVVGTGGTPRAGVAFEWRDGSNYRFEGVIAPGDSGSGAIVAGGLAAGNITYLAAGLDLPPVWNGGSTMVSILAYLGTSYRLATCSLPVPWPLTGCPPV